MICNLGDPMNLGLPVLIKGVNFIGCIAPPKTCKTGKLPKQGVLEEYMRRARLESPSKECVLASYTMSIWGEFMSIWGEFILYEYMRRVHMSIWGEFIYSMSIWGEFILRSVWNSHLWSVQGGEDSWDPLSCRSFCTTEPLNIGHFCGKWPIKIRDPIGLGHTVYDESS